MNKEIKEEPKKCMYTLDDFNDEDRKVTCDGCEEDCKYAQKEEPVSEELEEAASVYQTFHRYATPFKAYIDGANWKEQQFEKNRLKHCDSITNEQAELESDFIGQHLDKYQRAPTYLDAIEYGMKLKEQQMMAKAIDGHVTFEFYGLDSKTYGTIAHDPICLDDLGLKDTDKVKVIAINEG